MSEKETQYVKIKNMNVEKHFKYELNSTLDIAEKE